MRAGWTGPPAPPLPPLGFREGARFVWRVVAAGLATAGCLGLFLLLRMVDAVTGRRGERGRAPVALRFWARTLLPLAGLRLESVGEPMAGTGALVANHAGWLDIVVVMATTRARFVAKAEVRDWPGIGLVARATGTVFVERRAAAARRQGEALRRPLGDRERIVIFPEGTSTDGLRVLPFKSSLFEVFFAADLRETLQVQPVTIAYAPPARLPRSFYGWWGEAALVPSLAGVLAYSVGGRVVIVFHQPLQVAGFPGRKALAARAEAVVRAELAARLAAADGEPEGVECAGAT